MKFNPDAKSAGLPFLTKLVRVILVDVRGAKRVKEYVGLMSIPATLMTDTKQTVAWKFPELMEPLRGTATDVTDRGLNMVFPIVVAEDALSADGRRSLSLDEIDALWRRDEPRLKPIV